jgi:hypothetical protein
MGDEIARNQAALLMVSGKIRPDEKIKKRLWQNKDLWERRSTG